MEKIVDKQARAEQLFGHTPIKKAIWIVAIPSLLSALMFGLYTFMDQVLIQNLVPKTRFIFSDASHVGEISSYLPSGISSDYSVYKSLLNEYNSASDQSLAPITANTIVTTTTTAFQPLIIFSNSIVFLIPVGASVYYTKCVSKKLENTGRDLWATMFWLTAILALTATLVSFIFIWSGLLKVFAGRTTISAKAGFEDPNKIAQLQAYYDAAQKISIYWAKQYIYIYASGTILQGLSILLSYFIRAEGYNTYVMWWGIGANLINIGLDAVFIYVAKLGVLGGAIATIIGWTINLLAYIGYVIYMDKKQKTWLSLQHLFKFKWNKVLITPTLFLGFSGFIRTFGVAIVFAIMNILFTKPDFADSQYFQYYWGKGMPILSLFLISIFGINDGARSLMSYNFTRRDFKRCKETYLWTMLVAILYSVTAYCFIAATAGNLWLYALNVDDAHKAGTTMFIRILSLRIIALSLSISSLLAFQGTNDIGNSILASVMDNIICFAIIISIGFGIAQGVYMHTSNTDTSNWIIVSFFILNSLIASFILVGYSYWYVNKQIPKIDQMKITRGRRAEHKFFAEAEKREKPNFEITKVLILNDNKQNNVKNS